MISAYEHGWSAARRGKHIQACPFDAGTTEWQEWRNGFLLSSGQSTPDASAEVRGAQRGAEQIRSFKYDEIHFTEGSTRSDQLEDSPVVREWP